jgi:hypothetical protein
VEPMRPVAERSPRRAAPSGWRPDGLLPLRPLTFGELLDAAVLLLRTHAKPVLGLALVLAVAEQAALYPLRQLAGVGPPFYRPFFDRLGEYWLLLAAGLGTEAVSIAILAGVVAGGARGALLGERVPAGDLLRGAAGRAGGLAVAAPFAGVLSGLAALAGGVAWPLVYGFVGPVVPAMRVERIGAGRAVARGVTLAFRSGMRAIWVRLAGYLSWLAIRLALGLGLGALLLELLPATTGWRFIAGSAAWVLVNTIAYGMLACLDVALYLEVRMRSEALDLSISRDLANGLDIRLGRGEAR